VAVGGDGTVHEVVNGIADRPGVELAILPQGTGRDFVRTYGILRSLDDAVQTAKEGRVREIDLGLARFRSWQGEDTEAYFANIASAGMSGAIAKRANETSKALGGKASYFWSTFAVFARWRTSEITVEVGTETRRARMHDVIVANGRYLGGGMMICPQAEPDDGVFDVLVIGNLTKRDLLLTLPKTYRGRHLPHPKAELLRGTKVQIDADQPLPVELDGEQPGTTPVRFELVPHALRLRVPSF
jgi:diacylglycerol kinase (ATP)